MKGTISTLALASLAASASAAIALCSCTGSRTSLLVMVKVINGIIADFADFFLIRMSLIYLKEGHLDQKVQFLLQTLSVPLLASTGQFGFNFKYHQVLPMHD